MPGTVDAQAVNLVAALHEGRYPLPLTVTTGPINTGGRRIAAPCDTSYGQLLMTAEPGLIAAELLRPYLSVVVLEATSANRAAAVDELRRFLRAPASARSRRQVVLVHEGLNGTGPDVDGLDDLVPFVHRVQTTPSWQGRDGTLLDVAHVLSALVIGGDLIAVLVDGVWAERFQSWLDRSARSIRRVADLVMQRAFLSGETKGLWLTGAHAPLAAKPDSKSYTGRRLQDALNPHADGTFGLAAGRAAMPASADRVVLTGSVGTTPGRALVWSRRCDSLQEFAEAVGELFAEVRAARVLAPAATGVYPVLASRAADLTTVSGAYELTVPDVGDLPDADIDVDRVREAVELLQRSTLLVTARASTGPGFTIDVGLDGIVSGRLGGNVVERNGRRHLDLGYRSATDEPTTRLILRTLLRVQGRLTVRYRSGHAFMHGDVISSQIHPSPFGSWSWQNFDGFRIVREKPPGDVHAGAGQPGDNSLFGWIVQHYQEGWLTCDDGPGEVADFVHVDPAGTLSLIHAKAAHGDGTGRGVAVVPYQVVIAQAVKNLPFVSDRSALRHRLAEHTTGRACWSFGQRSIDRTDLLDALDLRDAIAPVRVVVVQPHISRAGYRRLAAQRDNPQPPDDVLRLHLVESLLTSAALSIVGRGAEFVVVGSDS